MNMREEIRLLAFVEQHLRFNFYPPYPVSLTQPCVAAIKNVRAGNGDDIIEFLGMTAQEVVDEYCLETFIE